MAEEHQYPQGPVDFWSFFHLFIPSLVNWLVPAAIMVMAVPKAKPEPITEDISMRRGARRIVALFFLTIITAVSFHNFLYLPPVIGMLTGLAYLQFFGYYLKKTSKRGVSGETGESIEHAGDMGSPVSFDIFRSVARAEWDTLLFFYGVVLCVGGLGFIGYLALASEVMYVEWGQPTPTWPWACSPPSWTTSR